MYWCMGQDNVLMYISELWETMDLLKYVLQWMGKVDVLKYIDVSVDVSVISLLMYVLMDVFHVCIECHV